MTALAILDVVLGLLDGLAATSKNKWDDLAVSALSRGIAHLREVRGTLVTKDQLEGLRVSPKW